MSHRLLGGRVLSRARRPTGVGGATGAGELVLAPELSLLGSMEIAAEAASQVEGFESELNLSLGVRACLDLKCCRELPHCNYIVWGFNSAP